MCIWWIAYFKMLLWSSNNAALAFMFQIPLNELEVNYRARQYPFLNPPQCLNLSMLMSIV